MMRRGRGRSPSPPPLGAFEDGFWAPHQSPRGAAMPFLFQRYEKAGMFAALAVRAPADSLPIGTR